MVVLTLDLIWQVAAWQFYTTLFLGAWGLSFVAWSRINSMKCKPVLLPGGPFLYHLMWLAVHIVWGFAAFMAWNTPDPSFPAVPGTWNTWPVPLFIYILLPLAVAIFHYMWWRHGAYLYGLLWLAVVCLGLNAAVVVLFLLIVKNLIAALICLAGVVWIVYLCIAIYPVYAVYGTHGPPADKCGRLRDGYTDDYEGGYSPPSAYVGAPINAPLGFGGVAQLAALQQQHSGNHYSPGKTY